MEQFHMRQKTQENNMDKAEKITVAEGMELSQGKDGHWLSVEAGGIYASINLENMHGIVRNAFLKWAEKTWAREQL